MKSHRYSTVSDTGTIQVRTVSTVLQIVTVEAIETMAMQRIKSDDAIIMEER
jgi:hypothetical protein